MLFYDLENFKKSLNKRKKSFYDIGKIQYRIIDFLKEKAKINCDYDSLVRTYAYTGEFTKELVSKIKKDYENNIVEESFYLNVKKAYESQSRFFRITSKFNFFEMRTYPLKYENGKIFQKGVDVQIAVDLVTHAFRNNFDIAVLCSGDIDLLESLKIVKSLGKKVIVLSHYSLTSKSIMKEADFYIDISKFSDEEIDSFSK